MLRDDKIIAHEPTRHPQNEELVIGNVRFNTHDLGGHAAARRLWRQYFAAVGGIVFLVDTTDHKRFAEAKEELSQLLSDDQLSGVPFLILGKTITQRERIHHAGVLYSFPPLTDQLVHSPFVLLLLFDFPFFL